MKRSISTAILFLSFVLALCNAGHATLARTATADPRVEPSGRYVAHIFTYPHTELEIYPGTSSIASNSTSRASASWGFITHAEYTGHHLPHWINGYQYQLTGLSCKEYLSHIYPSHNFW